MNLLTQLSIDTKNLTAVFLLNTTTNTRSESSDLTAEFIRYYNSDEHSICDANIPLFILSRETEY